MDAVRGLRRSGIDAIHGDATRPETLEAAGSANPGSLIPGSSGMANSAEGIRCDEPLLEHLEGAIWRRSRAHVEAAG
jgi:hypothetical protein